MGPRYRMTCTRAGFTRLENETVINAYRRSKNRLILLDIGGTLFSQVKVDNIRMFANAKTEGEKKYSSSSPARPSKEVMDALETLSSNTTKNTVFLISGQDNDSIAPLFEKIPNLGIVTDSGYTYRWSRSKSFQTMDAHFDMTWMDTADEIMQIYCRRTTGSYIENKQFAVLWRFGDADPDYGPLQASEMVDHLNNVLSNFSVLVIKGKGYVEVRPEGVDKGSVIKKILQFIEKSTHNVNPVDFILCAGDDVADEAMFSELLSYRTEKIANEELGSSGTGGATIINSGSVGVLGTSKEVLRAKTFAINGRSNNINKTGSKNSGDDIYGGSLGFRFGTPVTGGSRSDMSTYELWRQQYRSFRKGGAKGARGEAPKPVGPPLAVRLSMTSSNKTNRAPTIDGVTTPASNIIPNNLAMFTVTVGRKPSEASYFYDAPDDVVELLSSLAKTTSNISASTSALYKGNAQRSASLSDLSSLMSNLDTRDRSAFFWGNEVSKLDTNIAKSTVAQKREHDRVGSRRETQQARLKGRLTESTSLSNLAKLVEEGEILNEETVADSVSAHSVSAAYQTMEQYMDFEEEEAPGF